ncbi:MAG: glycerophosphodiester phosphodiesterase family protein [Clostridia bacterium]
MKIKKFLSSILAVCIIVSSFVFALNVQAGAEFSIDFSKMNDSKILPEGWQSIGNSEIKDGKLKLYGDTSVDNTAIVSIPKFANKSDFTMVVDFTIENAKSNDRWASLMFRGTSNDKTKNFAPYMQMCIRRDATLSNGVELATRTVSNSWTVHAKGASKSTSTQHCAKVIAKGKRIVEIIDDEVVINYSNALLTGYYFGLQANGCTMSIKSINIYDAEEIPEKKIPMQNVYEAKTNLVAPPTVFSLLKKAEDYDILSSETPPQVAGVVFENGKVSGDKTLDEFFKACGQKVIAAVEILESNLAKDIDLFIKYITDNKINEVMIMSQSIDIIKQVREKAPQARGVFIATKNDTKKIARDAHTAGASIVLLNKLDEEKFTQKDFEYLQTRSLAVWSASKDYKSTILQGVNGIVAANSPKEIYDFLEIFTEKTLVKDPIIIGHRGLPTAAPENTIESLKEAIKAGADVVENDAYLTKDGEIIITHNGTVDGYTVGGETGNVEDYTLEQLKAMTLKPFGTYSNCKFATMDEFFEVLKENPDVFLFAEIKSSKPELIKKFKELIDKYNIIDQIGVISFIDAQLAEVRKVIPQISVGNLKSSATAGAVNSLDGVYMMLNVINPIGTSFNPDFYSITSDMVRQANYRGISIWPWTLNNELTMFQQIAFGVNGITTDYANWSEKIISFVKPKTDLISLKTGEVIDLKGDVYNYHNKIIKDNASVKLKLIDNGTIELRETENGTIASKAGTGKAVVEYKFSFGTGNNYYNVISEIIDITVSGDDIPDTPQYTPGDINNDGKVNTLDALLILKHVAKLSTLQDTPLLAADYDKNGMVNTLDALNVLKFVANIES